MATKRKRTPEQNRAAYARRKARLAAAGTTVYQQREARAKALGWPSAREREYWSPLLQDDDFVRELAVEIGGPVEPERPHALMSRKANAIVNPTGVERRPPDWRLRLLIASGRMNAA